MKFKYDREDEVFDLYHETESGALEYATSVDVSMPQLKELEKAGVIIILKE